MKRTRLKRNTPLKRGKKGLRRTRIRRVSKTLAIENGHYLVERAVWIRDHPHCEACELVSGAQGQPRKYALPSRHVHHTKGRKGPLLRDQRWWKACCAGCHQYIEDHKEWARSVGLILYK